MLFEDAVYCTSYLSWNLHIHIIFRIFQPISLSLSHLKYPTSSIMTRLTKETRKEHKCIIHQGALIFRKGINVKCVWFLLLISMQFILCTLCICFYLCTLTMSERENSSQDKGISSSKKIITSCNEFCAFCFLTTWRCINDISSHNRFKKHYEPL